MTGAATRRVRRVRFYVRGHRVARDGRRPFRVTVAARRLSHRHRTRVAARILLRDGTRVKRARRVRPRHG